MTKLLTKKGKVGAEQLRISKLTNKHSAHFKVILSHQIENGFTFETLHRKKNKYKYKDKDVLAIFRALGKFIDDSIKMTITEVEDKYKRTVDSSDGTFDPETGTTVQVEHLCLYLDSDNPRPAPDGVRLHGYFRTNGGYFVITRLDWFHTVHKK